MFSANGPELIAEAEVEKKEAQKEKVGEETRRFSRMSSVSGHALALGAGFAAYQHGIGQGEFCQRFTGIRLEKHQLVADFDGVHAEGDVGVEVTAGLDFAHARIAKERGEEQVAQLVLQSDIKRGEGIFGLI